MRVYFLIDNITVIVRLAKATIRKIYPFSFDVDSRFC